MLHEHLLRSNASPFSIICPSTRITFEFPAVINYDVKHCHQLDLPVTDEHVLILNMFEFNLFLGSLSVRFEGEIEGLLMQHKRNVA